MRWPSVTSRNVFHCAERTSLARCHTFQISRRHESTKSSPSEADGTEEKPIDPRMTDLGRTIKDDFANFQDKYSIPKHPIVLAHGLMGFDELRLAGKYLPGVQYWRGITDAMQQNDIEVITTAVPTTGSIEERAHALHEQIRTKAAGKDVNIIAHSMGGLDARYLISKFTRNAYTERLNLDLLTAPAPYSMANANIDIGRIQPQSFQVKSLTTIATPHRGSSAADIILREIGPDYLPRLYSVLARMKIGTGAFSQLSRKYVCEEFNPATKDDPSVRYFSYGASCTPHVFSVFRISHDLMYELEGPNDGLVSVASSKWPGVRDDDGYKGTLMGVTHLDLINWTNRIKRVAARMHLVKQDFNAIAFYLHISHMLSQEGL